jgi:hypothetical protein
MIVIVLNRPRHKHLCPDSLLSEQAFENKCIDRAIFPYEAPEVSSKILDVLARKNVAEKILPNDLLLCFAKSIGGAGARIKDRPIVRQLIKPKHFRTSPDPVARLHSLIRHSAQGKLVAPSAAISSDPQSVLKIGECGRSVCIRR